MLYTVCAKSSSTCLHVIGQRGVVFIGFCEAREGTLLPSRSTRSTFVLAGDSL